MGKAAYMARDQARELAMFEECRDRLNLVNRETPGEGKCLLALK